MIAITFRDFNNLNKIFYLQVYLQYSIFMYNDIEKLICDNVSLKRAFQISKNHSDTLSTQLLELKAKYQNLHDELVKMTDQNSKLHEKNKNFQMQILNNNSSFTSQIEELKCLIEQKESQLENFQLKMIPTLDQDMLRVKIITQMEGPYQENIDKKEREIVKLKDQNHQLRRQREMMEYSLQNKQREHKKQLQSQKSFYENEVERLTRQISHFSQKSSSGKVDKDIIKSYRHEIDQLRSTCDFHRNLEEELRKQVGELKFEKEKLLAQLARVNAQRAIQIRNNLNEEAIKQLKKRNQEVQEKYMEAQKIIEKVEEKIRRSEAELKKAHQNREVQTRELKQFYEKQKQILKNQISEYRGNWNKYREGNSKLEQQYSLIVQKNKSLVKNQQKLLEQISSLQRGERKESEVDADKMEKEIRKRIERQLRISIQREFREKYSKEMEQGKKIIQDVPQKDQTRKIKDLENKIKKLSTKLEQANSKIIGLIREKATRKVEVDYISAEHQYPPILLQHRDCSFVSLCPPVAVEYLERQSIF